MTDTNQHNDLVVEIRKLGKKIDAVYNVLAFGIATPLWIGGLLWFLATVT